MSWGKFLVGALVLFIVFWLLLFFGYGNLVLADSVVPVEGMEVDEWLAGFRMCGGISGILGFICAAIWFYIGDGFAGERRHDRRSFPIYNHNKSGRVWQAAVCRRAGEMFAAAQERCHIFPAWRRPRISILGCI